MSNNTTLAMAIGLALQGWTVDGPDSDGDGIHDLVEAGGADADLDGRIDQLADGDGVGDSHDPDVDGDGFAGPFDDVVDGPSQGEPVTLPEVDGDGVPDLQQGRALSGEVETGLDGTGFGCSVATTGRPVTLDPLLTLLFGGSLVMLFSRNHRRALLRSSS